MKNPFKVEKCKHDFPLDHCNNWKAPKPAQLTEESIVTSKFGNAEKSSNKPSSIVTGNSQLTEEGKESVLTNTTQQLKDIRKAYPKKSHAELSNIAIHWLYDRGCSVFANEVPTKNGIADALGVVTDSGGNGGTVYYIEAKVSRGDLICKKQKRIYEESIWRNGMQYGCPGIDFYYLITGNGVGVENSLYPLWGVIDESGRVIRKAKRFKHNVNRNASIQAIAHVLVYKIFGKLYLPPPPNHS